MSSVVDCFSEPDKAIVNQLSNRHFRLPQAGYKVPTTPDWAWHERR